MINKQAALKCTYILKKHFANSQNNADVEYPDDLSNTTEEYLIYIFYSCLLDYGMKSKIYHQNLINTYKINKELFNPKYIINNYANNKEQLLQIIKDNIHPRYPNIATNKWLELSKYLSNINIKDELLKMTSYSELYQFITNIKGYGQKTGGLLLRLISESGICNFQDDIKIIPIDRHDIEISYLTGVISTLKPTSEKIKQLSDVWVLAANKNNISPGTIDQYLWTIGNTFCTKKKCIVCPLHDLCKKKN